MSPDIASDGGARAAPNKHEIGIDAASAELGRRGLASARRWVVKLGSALLTRDGEGLDEAAIGRFADGLARLDGELVVVSSGAVAAGLFRLGQHERPQAMAELQAAAAVGQMGLIQAWEQAFSRHGRRTALVLLTHEDISDRTRYLNARNTLRALLRHGVIPVINENDTVATDEIRLGDNDTLAALVTNLVEADALALLTDVAGLHDRDPRTASDAVPVHAARASAPALDAMVHGSAGRLGRGGMFTKLRAARLAARSGASTLILDGRDVDLATLPTCTAGTLLLPDQERMAARKRWIAGHLQTRGEVILDAGAARALRDSGRSLLPVGVLAVRGAFARGDLVVCRDEAGVEIARGLANYSSVDAERIRGHDSDTIMQRLGYVAEPELVHRDNMVLV